MKRIEGVLPAMFTPMGEDGAIQPAMITRLVNWYLDQGVHGLYVCGSTGEGLLLTEAERMLVAQTTVEAMAGRGIAMIHVGALATDEAVRLAKHAERIGADAVSAVPPFAFGRTAEGIKAHYRAIGESCGLPLYVYNIPSLTGVNINADLVAQLMELPNVRGMKFSDDKLFEEFRIIELSPEFAVFHGSDEILLHGLMMGAVGGIGLTYNFAPALVVELYNQFRQGNLAAANKLQLRLSRMIDGFLRFCNGNSVGLGKITMRLLGFECGSARLPNPPIPAAAARDWEEFLRRLEFFDELPAR